jgi:hypothetical protein
MLTAVISNSSVIRASCPKTKEFPNISRARKNTSKVYGMVVCTYHVPEKLFSNEHPMRTRIVLKEKSEKSMSQITAPPVEIC